MATGIACAGRTLQAASSYSYPRSTIVDYGYVSGDKLVAHGCAQGFFEALPLPLPWVSSTVPYTVHSIGPRSEQDEGGSLIVRQYEVTM